jgi:hypothetical protein
MPRNADPSASGRLVVQKFAAHLAYLLNDGDLTVSLNFGDLYRKLLRTLSGGKRADGNPYVETLVAIHLLGDRNPDEAATAYFERVLNRPLFLARRAHRHKGHELFLALCRRGFDERWKTADLNRFLHPPPPSNSDTPPDDFRDVSDRISAVRERKGHISPGNPAATTRTEHGPLYLNVVARSVEVEEELSIWDAICSGPRSLRALAPPDFDEFCSLVIKAVEVANAHYGALVTLRLSPLDWADELSVNTAKKLSAFISDVRSTAETMGALPEAVEVWELVWKSRQVPGFPSARSMFASPLGHALRLSGVVSRPSLPSEEEMDEEGDEHAEATFAPSRVPEMVRALSQAGLLDSYDGWLLRQLANRKTLRQLALSPRTLFKFGRPEIPEDYIAKLRERIRARSLEAKASR